jgi:glycosyltransferase involved in cell wall biosynthesis
MLRGNISSRKSEPEWKAHYAMSIDKPRVSIGLPVFNGESYVGQAIGSILGQTFRELELVICDNASTDRTQEICRHYAAVDSRVHYHRNACNIGASANFNRTFALASGSYFKWAAHDDVLAPEFVELCLAALERQPDAVLAQSLVRIIDANGNTVSTHDNELQRAASPRSSVRFASLIRTPRPCWEVFGLIRRNALAATSLIDTYAYSDVTLCAELSLLGRFLLVPQPLFMNRDHAARFCQAALTDRTASWQWWCMRDHRTARFIDLCPTWLIQANHLRTIRRHISDPRERLRLYLTLLRHVFSRHAMSRLMIEPITAASPRIHAAGRWAKRRWHARNISGFDAAAIGPRQQGRK